MTHKKIFVNVEQKKKNPGHCLSTDIVSLWNYHILKKIIFFPNLALN